MNTYYQNHKEEINDRRRALYKEKTKDRVKLYKRVDKTTKLYKDKIKAKNKRYLDKLKNDPIIYKKYRETRNQQTSERINNINKDPIKKEEWKIKLKEYRRKYNSKPENAMARAIRNRLNFCLSKSNNELGKTEVLTGLKTKKELKQYIEAQFCENMTWENKGKYWVIDHIIPLSMGKQDKELLIKLNHYKNLRPLEKNKNWEKFDNIEFWPEGVPFTKEELGLSEDMFLNNIYIGIKSLTMPLNALTG